MVKNYLPNIPIVVPGSKKCWIVIGNAPDTEDMKTVQCSASSQSKNSTSSALPGRPRTWSALFDDKPVRIVFVCMCQV